MGALIHSSVHGQLAGVLVVHLPVDVHGEEAGLVQADHGLASLGEIRGAQQLGEPR